MSESLRDLVVTLSLNSDNFKKNINSVSLQIKEAQKEFTLAATGINNFDKSLDGMRAKSASLNQQLTLQNRVVDQYGRALEVARKRLSDSVDVHRQVETSLESAREEYERISETLKEFKKVYKQVSDSLGEESAKQLLGDQLEDFEHQAKAAGNAVEQLEGKVKVAERTMRSNADSVTRAKNGYLDAQAAAKRMASEIDELNKKIALQETGWYSMSQSLENFSEKADKFSRGASRFGRSMSAALTTPIVGAAVAVNKASIDYETAFTSVRKTVDATEGEFSELSAQIKQMSTEVAMDASDIAEIFAIAGQMGIETENLAEFARVMIDLGNSTDISSEEAATALSQFRNITGMASGDVDRLASTIVDLGNKFSTTESEIMEMALRLAGAGEQVGLSEPEILAFAAALSSVGIEAEMGGSALSKALVKMEVAVETGSDSLEDFSRVAGMTESAFSEMWKSDPASAFMSFLTGLSMMDEEGISAIATLSELGIEEVRLRDTLLRSTNAIDLLRRTQSVANDAWRENVAATNEANRRYATTESRMKNMVNRFKLFGMTLGDDMNPMLNEAIDGLSEFADWLNNLDLSTRTTIINIAALAASIGPASLALGGMSKAASVVTANLAPLFAAIAKNGPGLKGLVTTLTTTTAGFLALSAGVGVAALALADYATGASKARAGITAMNDAADRWKRTQAETIYDNEGLGSFNLSESDFSDSGKALIEDAEKWKSNLIEIWNDGKRETNATVKEWSNSFIELNNSVRDELNALKENADKYGYADVSAGLQNDIDTLNSMDKEIEKLLNKRKNRNLTEKDQERLDELIQQREAIVIKYRLEPEGPAGYQQILDQLEADEAKANAAGTKVSSDRYAEAVKATAEGYAAAKKSIDEWYDSEYATVQLIQEEEERRAAQASLDQRYNDERTKAAQEYAQTLSQVVGPVMESAGIQQAEGDLERLTALLGEFSTAVGGDKETARNNLLSEIGKLSESLDEGNLASYLSLLTQIQSLYTTGGMEKGLVESMFGFDPDTYLGQFQRIFEFVKTDGGGELEGLASMLGEYLPQEVQKIMIDLDMTDAAATWSSFAENPGALVNADVGSIEITGSALSAFNAYTAANPVNVAGVVKLSNYDGDIESLFAGDGARLFDENGLEIPITPDIIESAKLGSSDFLIAPNEQGGVDIIVVPKVQGTAESVAEAGNEVRDSGTTNMFGLQSGGALSKIPGQVELLTEKLKAYNAESEKTSKIPVFGGLINSNNRSVIENLADQFFNAEDIANIQTFMQEAFSALSNGEQLLPEDASLLQSLMGMVSEMDTAGVGQDIVAGISAGMQTETDWDTVSSVVGTDIVTAFKTALGIQSPSTVMADSVGIFIPQGIAQGMMSYSLAPASAKMASSAFAAIKNAFPVSRFIGFGMNISQGIAAGILAGIPAIVAAAEAAAEAANDAAKRNLKIFSPSRRTEKEIGVPWVQGIAVGIEEETRRQSKAIGNAVRYMTDVSAGYADGQQAYDNRRTYNNTSSANVNVQNMYVGDKQDIYSLALEISALVKRQNSGRGM